MHHLIAVHLHTIAMPDKLEDAALSGALFRAQDPASPSRSSSSSTSRPSSPVPSTHPLLPTYTDRPGAQTGPKGVISDRRFHDRQAHDDAAASVESLRVDQERRAIVAPTVEEEDVMRWRERRMAELRESEGPVKRGLREVGKEGFVAAVERNGWVVVLIYEPVRYPTDKYSADKGRIYLDARLC